MVFGLIRKDDANFQTLDESCAFSCFDAHEASDSPSSKQQQVSGVEYFNSKNLLATIDPSDNLDEDSDSNLLGDLMPYLNSTKNLVRAPSMDKESHEESESATRTVLRAPSMDRTNSFVKYENGEGSEGSESLDDLEINDNMQIMQLELPGIATVSTTGVNNTNSLDNLIEREEKEAKNTHRTDASIAFTACFDLTTEDTVAKSEPIMLTMGSASIDLNELVLLEIVDEETLQKVRQFFTQDRGKLGDSEVTPKETSVDEATRRRGRRRDSQNQSTGSSLQTDSKVTNTSELKSSDDISNGDRQSELMQRRRNNFSSPDRKKIQDEKRSNKEVEMKNSVASNDGVPASKRRTPERRSPNKGTNSGNNKCNTTDPDQNKRSKDSSPNKIKSSATSSSTIVESQKRPENTTALIANDNITSTKRIKPRRSNSMNSVESFRHADIISYRLSNENARSSVGDTNFPATKSSTNESLNELEGHIINDVSSPVSSKKHISLFGNTGNKMIKFLSSRYLNQEKERPCLVKAESQAIIGTTCTLGVENVNLKNKDSASADEFMEFKGHLVDGTVPFTPRSQKRFLNWRAIGLKKSLTIGNSSRHLIEGELDELETETQIENHYNDATNISRPGAEFTVQNTTTLPDRDSNEALDVAHKIASETGARKNTAKVQRERINHVSSSNEQNCQNGANENAQAYGNDRQGQSTSKTSRATSKTPPRRSIVRTSTPDSQFSITYDVDRDVIDSSDHSLSKQKHSDSISAIESRSSKENIGCDNVMENHTSSYSHDNSKSPSRRRSSISKGLSQSVHVHSSPAKKGGKGSSTAVSRRQRLLASTVLDDGPSTISNNDNNNLVKDVPKQLSEPIFNKEKTNRQPSPDLVLNPISGVLVGESRPPKNLSRSLHVSSPTKKMGKNTEVTVDVNIDQSYKCKMPSKGLTASDSGNGIDLTEVNEEKVSKPLVPSRTRKTTCKEFKKEFAAEPVPDEPAITDNVGRRRRNSLGMPIKGNNKAS